MAGVWEDAWPLILLVLAGLALVALMVSRVAARWRARRPSAPLGPVPVPPEEAELVEGPVFACMKCGSTHVRLASVLQGGIPGAGDQFLYVCARCRHRGPPLEFESVTAYRQFVKGLRDEGP